MSVRNFPRSTASSFSVRAVLITLFLAPCALAQNFDFQGYVAARAVNASGPESWLDGGIGRLETGGNRDEFDAVAQLGFDWIPSRHFDLHVSGVARPEEAGLIEAYADGRLLFGLDELQLRAGQFFLPTSRENKDALWASPYAISFSSLNTWIAQEVRPIGVDLEWRHTLQRGHVLTTAATAFRGNDSMGALLGWRGWTVGNRLSAWNEVLPLPPLASFKTFFDDQRDDGTKPFGRDLDGNTGYAARVRYSVPQRGNVQYAYVDNRGDRQLHRGEYAWATDFHLLGGEIGNTDTFVVAAEVVRGSTGMGFAPAFVQGDFYAAYLLLSGKRGRNRWTARYDVFGVDEKDFSLADANDESGRSWTLAWLYDVTPSIRGAAELTQITGKNFGGQGTNGRTVTVEARYSF
jgi:hypothetical protein